MGPISPIQIAAVSPSLGGGIAGSRLNSIEETPFLTYNCEVGKLSSRAFQSAAAL